MNFRKLTALLMLTAFVSSLAAPATFASRTPDQAETQTAAKKDRRAKVNFSKYGGYIVFDQDKKPVCGMSPFGAIGMEKCDSRPEIMAMVHQTKPRYAVVTLKGEKTAEIVTTVVGMSLALLAVGAFCGSAGYITGIIVKEKNDVVIVAPGHYERAGTNAVFGFVASWSPAKTLIRLAAPALGAATTALSAVPLGGAVCAASAGAGYAVHHFFFADKNDPGPTQ